MVLVSVEVKIEGTQEESMPVHVDVVAGGGSAAGAAAPTPCFSWLFSGDETGE